MADDTNAQLLAELINSKNSGASASEIAALSNNCQNSWSNNPFMYLIWLAFFGGNGFGFGGNNNNLSERLSSIERQAQDNHNNELAMNAIKGNADALRELAGNLNVGVTSLSSAVDSIQSGIAQVGSALGLSGEKVINAIGAGNLNIIQQLKDCCCSTQKEILKMGYDNQIATLNQTNDLQARLTNIASAISSGFSATAYETQRQTCDIINAAKDNTQKIIDTLNAHWQLETSQALQDSKFEISQLRQTQALVAALKTSSTTTTT